MKILTIEFTGTIYWLVEQSDSLRFSSQTFKSWYLINPLAYSFINSHLPADERELTARYGTIFGNSVIVEANGLVFEVPDEFDMDEMNADHISELVNQFVTRLRSVSQQVHLSGISVMIMRLSEIEGYPEMVFPEATGESWIRRHIADTAITVPEMEEADRQSGDYAPPIFRALLLDGIQALDETNHRTAILYATMSIETISATKLDEAYDAALSDENNPKYRVVKQASKKGEIENRDPVYKYLSNRTDFGALLHEQPLYLLERSLLIDDKPLYDEAIKLYKTRNKVVHRGELPEDQDGYLEIDEEGARTAIECATRIFRWFGESDRYVLPSKSFVRGYAASSEVPSF